MTTPNTIRHTKKSHFGRAWHSPQRGYWEIFGFQFLRDNVAHRIAGRQTKVLTLTGRATLVKFVSSTKPSYTMQTSLLQIFSGETLQLLVTFILSLGKL